MLKGNVLRLNRATTTQIFIIRGMAIKVRRGKWSAFLVIPHLRAFASLYQSCGQGFRRMLPNHSFNDMDTYCQGMQLPITIESLGCCSSYISQVVATQNSMVTGQRRIINNDTRDRQALVALFWHHERFTRHGKIIGSLNTAAKEIHSKLK